VCILTNQMRVLKFCISGNWFNSFYVFTRGKKFSLTQKMSKYSIPSFRFYLLSCFKENDCFVWILFIIQSSLNAHSHTINSFMLNIFFMTQRRKTWVLTFFDSRSLCLHSKNLTLKWLLNRVLDLKNVHAWKTYFGCKENCILHNLTKYLLGNSGTKDYAYVKKNSWVCWPKTYNQMFQKFQGFLDFPARIDLLVSQSLT